MSPLLYSNVPKMIVVETGFPLFHRPCAGSQQVYWARNYIHLHKNSFFPSLCVDTESEKKEQYLAVVPHKNTEKRQKTSAGVPRGDKK